MTEDRIRDLVAEAVERQLAEQKALRAALEALVGAVEQLTQSTKIATTSSLEAVKAGAAAALDAAQTGAATATDVAQRSAAVATEVATQASKDADERVTRLAELLVEGLRDLANTQQKALESSAEKSRRMFRDAARAILSRVRRINTQLIESDELASRLRIQASQLDQIIAGIGDAPEKIDAVIGQALRRALTVRATITQHANEALTDIFDPLKQEVHALTQTVDGQGVAAAIEELSARQEAVEEAIARIADGVGVRLKSLGAPSPKRRSQRSSR